jgi:hypothetical protein
MMLTSVPRRPRMSRTEWVLGGKSARNIGVAVMRRPPEMITVARISTSDGCVGFRLSG